MEERTSKALTDTVAERQRQKEVEGWMPQHDDEHTEEQLASAATAYLMSYLEDADAGIWWPEEWGHEHFKPALKPSDRRRDLIKAAALILAEVERLDRAALAQPAGEGEV